MTTPAEPRPDGSSSDDAVWGVLQLIALQQGLDEEPDERAAPLARADFDHGRLVEQAMRHGLLAALAHYLHRHGLRRTLPARLRNPVLSYLLMSEHRAHLLTHEALRVSTALEGAGIQAAWTKGVVLQSTLYDDSGVRTYNDIDLMIAPADRERTQAALVDLGYEAAVAFDPTARELRKISRAAERMYRMSPDHLPHFHRLVDDLCVPHISVDVANSLTWHGSAWHVPLGPVMAQRETVNVLGGTPLPTLSPTHCFLFLCLHLFREAWVQRTVQTKDVSLAQFADIARQWRRSSPQTRRRVAESVATWELAGPVAWVCAHTDALLGTEMVAGLGLAAAADPAWLASGQGGSGRRLTWSGDMRERLRSPHPPELVPVAADA
ncbi:nucleotidyltransferase family protein [Streptomyces sp. NPDC001966]